MKGLGANRSRHLSDSCDPPPLGPPEAMYPLATDPRSPYLLSPTVDHYGTLDPNSFPPPSPSSLPPECMLPLNNQISNSSTFPRIHYNSDVSPSSMPGIPTATLGTSISMGMGMGMGMGMNIGMGLGAPIITSGSATISAGSKINRLPANLLDQFEKQLPVQRDGFSTLQFHRSGASKQRSDSPGRIRYLMHSVQKLFAKSQSLENSVKGNINGRLGNTGADSGKQNRRSKSKDRAKTEGAKRQPRSNISGFWNSEDNLDNDAGSYHTPVAMMTLGRPVPDSQTTPKYFPQGYNTISEHTLKTSKSSNDLKLQACPQLSAPAQGEGGGEVSKLVKGGSWSTLTLSQPKLVCQKGSATIDKSLLKSKSCHQELTCRYLQAGEWSSTLGRIRGSSEIPCRRMRSGSYVKAMGDLEDSEDSEGSPKPSPKSAARRHSYLKATQQSLSEQLPPRNCLPSLCELSTNRSLENLDCMSVPPSATFPNWDEDDFTQGCNALSKSGCESQVQETELSGPPEDPCPNLPFHQASTEEEEVLDLPLPTCFRSRSHSYLRAIQAGCSQDEDTASLDSDSPPPTATTVRTYSSSSISTCITTCKRTPPPVPPRTTSKPYISVTVQSSTESAQDNYLDSQERKNEAHRQRSNSSDSQSSVRPSGPAKDSPAQTADVPSEPSAPSSPPKDPQHETLKPPVHALAAEEPQVDPVPKRKLSSIGIQVDCILPVQKEEPPPLTRFQSIGVQVEDSWQLSRASSMASKQEMGSDAQDLPNDKSTDKSVTNTTSQSLDGESTPQAQGNDEDEATRQPTNRTATRSSSSSFSESLDPALDPSSLPPPDPWLESGSGNGNGTAPSGPPQASAPACHRDGHWFLKLLQAETARMEGWCQQMEQETKDNQLSEEVLGRIRSAVGSAQLLMSQKFQQFRGLCDQNLNVNANPRPTAQDLAGFWDLLQLSIEDISMKFDELYQLKSNDWQLADSADKKEEKKQPPPVPKKPNKGKPVAGRDKATGGESDKQRQEARKRLMAAKRAASVRQNSATESADSIEIYVPEAQTRL
ncbi:disks large-associated protein 4-like [Arapaima gigas]